MLLVLKALSLKDRCFIDFIHKKATEEAKKIGVFTEFELRSRLKIKNIWDEKSEEYIDAALNRIKELEDTLAECKKGDRKYRITTNLLKSHRKTIEEELRRKAELFYVTAEQYADEIKNRAVVFCCTYDEFENKYWESWADFEKEKDLVLIGNIAEELNRLPSYDTKEIRKIARSVDWRYMWAAAKGNIQALFGMSVGEFNIEQKNLVYWSQVYDSVYEAYERPSEDIINDDEALDEWFEEQSKKSKRERLDKAGETGKIKVSEEVRRHGEVFIITNPYINQSAPTNEDVENLNSSFVREFKRSEQDRIKQKGMIREQDLRSRKNKIARRTIGSSDAVIGNRNLAGRARGKSQIKPGGTL